MEPLRTLVDDGSAAGTLPDAISALYGGGLTMPAETCYANFVESLDGVVALEVDGGGPATIALHSEADRLVMGILRSLADCVVVGAGTVRDGWNHHWTPGHVYPDLQEAFTRLQVRAPQLVVVTASGNLDPAQPALHDSALVLTTDAGARRLGNRLPASAQLRSLGEARLTSRAIIEAVRAEGHRRLLTEGGPHLLGSLLRDRLLDELFLTLSPVLAGRMGGDSRLAMVHGVELLPERPVVATLRSLKTEGSHLFLRYDLRDERQEQP
ncbi:MAG: dihydrofolate reductase family protein [Candidatus Dormiibacterota bacterium]